MTSQTSGDPSDPQGPNSWFIQELYQEYLDNPRSVPVEWQEIFAQGPPGTVAPNPPAEGRTVRLEDVASAPAAASAPAQPATAPAQPATAPTPSATAPAQPATAPAQPATAPTPSAFEPSPTPVASANAGSQATTPPAPAPKPAPAPSAPEAPAPAGNDGASTRSTGSTTGNGAGVKSAADDGNGEGEGDDDGTDDGIETVPLRGVSALIASNMEASLEVPTATSFREIPAKLLEVNRRILNNHLKRVRGGKVSFTHVIGYAVVTAIKTATPSLSNSYRVNDDGKPELVRNAHVNLGIAVDLQRDDGTRTLMVPVIKRADELDFSEFVDAYEALIDKVRNNKVTVDDLTGANVTLTNPGTIGTVQSVPRLMKGQGVIVGVGRIGYPTEYEAADPKMLAQLGISKIIAITSTYDHRIIQGAESGLFLKKVHELLLGEDGFYDQAFHDVGVPYEAVKWRIDHGTTETENGVDGSM
ncbi:MAG: 2-oxo acid dehydrogenase subunit E2, partial [Acidimicrobiia bacterium]|nr:2-oxo acid dehydrogenase subunit E2 [Acidimicrobiia bacterium]